MNAPLSIKTESEFRADLATFNVQPSIAQDNAFEKAVNPETPITYNSLEINMSNSNVTTASDKYSKMDDCFSPPDNVHPVKNFWNAFRYYGVDPFADAVKPVKFRTFHGICTRQMKAVRALHKQKTMEDSGNDYEICPLVDLLVWGQRALDSDLCQQVLPVKLRASFPPNWPFHDDQPNDDNLHSEKGT